MLILLTELVCGVLLFMFYYVPDVRQQMGGSLSPDETLKEAIVRYRDDDDLRDTIDSIQREVSRVLFVSVWSSSVVSISNNYGMIRASTNCLKEKY